MACFVSLLQDAEGDVRAGAVSHLAPMVHWGGPELFQTHISPLLPALADDTMVEVRNKCALGIMNSTEGGTLADSTIVKTFGPLLENFLQDEYSEVQLHVLTNLSRISHLLHQLSGVVTTILNMAKASNWRVREGVAQLLPHLADARGMDFFSSVLLEPAWLALLLDPVCSVRTACVDGIVQLVHVAGEEWIVANLLPQHLKIYAHSESAYLMRMTILRAHAQMALAAQRGNLFYQVVEFLCGTGLKDKVSNVRMVTAKGLDLICQSGKCDPDVVQSKIRRAIEEQLAIEEDPDCVYFMTVCLQSC
jgi:serine/threonine-protein phosphatase 2A regulatory subunit A